MIHFRRPTETIRRRRTGALLVALAFTAAACVGTGASASGASGSAATTPGPSAPAVSGPPDASPGTVPADVLAPLITDAASRTGAAPDTITVVEARAMTWTTGALGCPQPGMMYTQVISNGWQVILSAGGTRIDYRTTGPGRFAVCGGAGA